MSGRMHGKRGIRFLVSTVLMLFLGFAAARADVVINEVMASNGFYENGQAPDWIELYNNGKKTVSLSGWYLSDSKKNPLKWSFPEGAKLKAGAFLTVFCMGEECEPGKGNTFYAPFAISSGGETLVLSDAEGTEIQRLKIPAQYGCVSFGLPAKEEDYGFFEHPTRNRKNDDHGFTGRTENPVCLTPAGFYADQVLVTAEAPEGAVLRYTTDGETPTEKSRVFPSDGLLLKKTTPLRLKAFREEMVSSETVSATFLINDDPVTPIVSLITDDQYLFNRKTGLLVKGTGSIPNYSKGWEYPVHIEYFTAEGDRLIAQNGTFTCSGHSARINAQKSLALYARKSWGKDSFSFNPFPTRDYDGYKSLLLRAANSDAYATRIRDIVASSLAEGQGILYQDHQIIQVYINGSYYGHYNLREKINKYFIAQYEDVTDPEQIDRIDILARTGSDQFLQNGDNTDWLDLCDFCRKEDLNVPENLARVEQQLDIDSLFTHAAYEIILGNVDFTNVRIYRIPGGKWRYLLFDVEACWRNLERTPIEYYIKPVSAKIQGFRHEPLNALLKVPEMKDRFLRRVAELLTTVFRWDHVKAVMEEATGTLEQILPRHIARWKNMKLANWKKNIHAIKYYARVRPKKIPELLKAAMKLTAEETEFYFGEALALLEQTNAPEQ